MRFLLWAALPAALPAPAPAADSAVVFLYHRFDEDASPSTGVTAEQLRSHVEALKSGGYTVLPLAAIAERIRSGAGVPERTIGLSLERAYASAYHVAFPILKAAGFPFTVFVATDQVGTRDIMSWDQLREIVTAGNAVGGHAA